MIRDLAVWAALIACLGVCAAAWAAIAGVVAAAVYLIGAIA